jgi:hypothetical protein
MGSRTGGIERRGILLPINDLVVVHGLDSFHLKQTFYQLLCRVGTSAWHTGMVYLLVGHHCVMGWNNGARVASLDADVRVGVRVILVLVVNAAGVAAHLQVFHIGEPTDGQCCDLVARWHELVHNGRLVLVYFYFSVLQGCPHNVQFLRGESLMHFGLLLRFAHVEVMASRGNRDGGRLSRGCGARGNSDAVVLGRATFG